MSEELNQWVNKQIIAQDISMNKLEKLADIPRGYVSKVLSGKRNASMDFYFKIAYALNAVPDMLKVIGITVSAEDEENFAYSTLFQSIKRLNPEARRHLSSYVAFLVAQDENG